MGMSVVIDIKREDLSTFHGRDPDSVIELKGEAKMREKFTLITIVGVVVFAGLMLLVSCLTFNPLTQAKTLDASTTVIITENGFDPSVVMIEVGTTVVWINQTQLIL